MLKIHDHGGIRELQMARPPANALNSGLVRELRTAIEAAPEAGVRAIVLSGMPGMYSGGLDVPELLGLDRAAMGHFWQDFFRLLQSIAVSPLPIAAAITGHSPAGGAVLAIFCDVRIAAQGKFKMGLNEVQVGLPVPRVILAALVRLVGERQAEHLAVHGLLVSPEEALQAGLVDRVVAQEEVIPEALAWCRGVIALPSLAMQETRNALRADFKTLFDTLGPVTGEEMTRVWFSAESQSVLRALVEKLAAKKK
jgi:enoyl-CoA hydratase/carnithine racemase